MKALVFTVGHNHYLLDIDTILRITRFDHMLSLDNPPKFIKGVSKFRSAVIPIIDLPQRFDVSSPQKPGYNACFIIFRGPKGMVGLYADSANDIIEISPSDLPETGRDKGRLAKRELRKIKVGDRVFFLLRPEELFDESEWKTFCDIYPGEVEDIQDK